MTRRNERFNQRLLSLEARDAMRGRPLEISDGGAALRRLVEHCDAADEQSTTPREQALADEAMLLLWGVLLTARGDGRLVPTLLAIARCGGIRQDAIALLRRQTGKTREAARRLYFRARGRLEAIFVSARQDGAFLDV